MRPTDENQYGATRPNLMSSGSRRGPSEENILAMLERDAARRRIAGNPRFTLYAVSSVVVLGLMGALAWLLHENNNANDVLRLSEQPGVSVTVVPDKPAAQAPTLAMASEAVVHPSTAATIIDNPEPPGQKTEESHPAVLLAKDEGPRMAPPPAKAGEPPAAATAAKNGVHSPGPAKKAEEPRPAAAAAKNDVPPLVLLSPAQAAAARGTAARRDTDAKKGAAKESAAHGQGATRSVAKGSTASASSRTSSSATGKNVNATHDDAKRAAVREHGAETSHASRGTAASKQSSRTKAAAAVAGTPAAKSATARNATPAHTRKNAAGTGADAPVDTDVALISAIIMHSDSRAHRSDDGCASSDKKCAAKPSAQQP